MKTNQSGLSLIKRFEGLSLKAYQCTAGKWTIGYGHTKGVTQGMTISQDTAELFFDADVSDAENSVNTLVHVPLTEDQYAALVSFVFNFGPTKFITSTLLRELNKGNYDKAAEEFPKWIHSNGKVDNGLVKRRLAEQELFTRAV